MPLNLTSPKNFKREFDAVAGGHFGSGWAWLVLDTQKNKLAVVGTHDADNHVLSTQYVPLFVCDVWEHAYYIDYRNARANYVEAWWKVANWQFAEDNLNASLLRPKA
eukprot:TRINITY_DN62403_c0_g1_i1.p2 TRINITY_DN62403_c0_g1~~TRINITY_DN62403_c0_g1_i1.p2  ORF type:complete len:107 (-),score=5.33 TRINITY_DN62403_c0_g1_i1:38-358(-)